MTRLLAALAAIFLSGIPAGAQVPGSLGVQVTASSGTVAAGTAAATLAAVAGKVTHICGFAITSTGSTAAAVVAPTVTGVVTATMTFAYASVAGATLSNQPLVVSFRDCISASAPNTTIVVSMPTLGAGNTNATVNAWGYQR